MQRWPSAVAVLLLLALLQAGAVAGGLTDSLPPSGLAEGWSRQGEARSFTPAKLYEYIDGAADLFLSYGLKEMAAATYAKDGAPDRLITVDIYDMGAPLHAYGIFATERPARGVSSFGAEGYVSDGLVAFAKGRYYVKIAVMESDDVAQGRLLGEQVAKRFPGSWGLPAEFKRLPARGRVAGSERYVRKDALGHRGLTDVISAEYRVGTTLTAVHIADLTTAAQAKQSWQKLREFEQRAGAGVTAIAGVGEECFAARDASYGEFAAARKGRFVVIGTSETAKRNPVMALVTRAVAGVK